MTNDLIGLLADKATRLRIHSINATTEAGSGHPTSGMSAADVVATLFFHLMRYDPQNAIVEVGPKAPPKRPAAPKVETKPPVKTGPGGGPTSTTG